MPLEMKITVEEFKDGWAVFNNGEVLSRFTEEEPAREYAERLVGTPKRRRSPKEA
jgi:hypothetical protein